MMTFLRLVLVASVLASRLSSQEWTETSPDGAVRVVLSLSEDGVPRFAVEHRDKAVILASRLGFEGDDGERLRDGFEALGDRRRQQDTAWSPPYGERRTIPDRYREVIVSLRQRTTGRRLDLVARAYNEGVALRYEFPSQPKLRRSPAFSSECTEFRFPAGTFAYEEYGTEGAYRRVSADQVRARCQCPLTVELPNGSWASVVEAAVDRYPPMLLSPLQKESGLVSSLAGPVRIMTPFSTPWRAVVVGERAGDLLERSHLVLNLNLPCAIDDTSWIKPGKANREMTLSTAGGKACVDFAVARGLSYVLYDGGWYGNPDDDASDALRVGVELEPAGRNVRLDLPAVIAYAKQRGIGVFLYVDRRALERQLDEILPTFARWGVAGIKFGFVDVGSQEAITWLLGAVRLAAANRLMVDIHDGYRPSGFSRTYPNLLTQEGVRGNEHMPTAAHNATLPFTRMIAGAADYTICYYASLERLKTTRAHQLALAVVNYSPLQLLYWYDQPSSYRGEPEIAFFDRVPTVWDDTRVIVGKVGEAVSVARRSGEDWYMGTITGDAAATLSLPLAFLETGRRYRAHLFENGDGRAAVRQRIEEVDSGSVLTASLPAAGGQAIWLTPVR